MACSDFENHFHFAGAGKKLSSDDRDGFLLVGIGVAEC
jgi:hypothetical protein